MCWGRFFWLVQLRPGEWKNRTNDKRGDAEALVLWLLSCTTVVGAVRIGEVMSARLLLLLL